MLTRLPTEIQYHILDYIFNCRKNQNFYINKEIQQYICQKHASCKVIKVFSKNICAYCWKKEIYLISMLQYY